MMEHLFYLTTHGALQSALHMMHVCIFWIERSLSEATLETAVSFGYQQQKNVWYNIMVVVCSYFHMAHGSPSRLYLGVLIVDRVDVVQIIIFIQQL